MNPVQVVRVGAGRDLFQLWCHLRSKRWGKARRAAVYMWRFGARRRAWWGIWEGTWAGSRSPVRGLTRESCRRKALALRELDEFEKAVRREIDQETR